MIDSFNLGIPLTSKVFIVVSLLHIKKKSIDF
jgi:hypothetical protein